MIINIYTIYDSKAETYAQPHPAISKAVMIRTFTTIANDKTHPIGMHPEDYTLFEIATWDDQKGEYKMHEAKVSLGLAIEFITQE